MVGGPSIILTRKALVEETHTRKSANVWKLIVGLDTSRLYPYSMCQPMPTRLYSRYKFYTVLQKFKPRQNKS